MPTHLYCLLLAGGDSARPPAGESIRVLEANGIAAWVADAEADRLPRDRTSAARYVVEHDRVIGLALMRGITPVPALLTDPYASDSDVLADVSRRTPEILASLSKVAGAVEMAVILAIDTESDIAKSLAPSQAPGRAYLERLRGLPVQAEALSDRIEARLRPLAVASDRRSQGTRVSLSHLIRREDMHAYRTAALTFVSPAYRMIVDGPRPPYSFAAFSPSLSADPTATGTA